MKKIFMAGVLSLFSYVGYSQFLSSSTNSDDKYNIINIRNTAGVDMSKAKECFNAAKKITYLDDFSSSHPVPEYWQNPSETDIQKTGDCEDQAIYLQKLLYDKGIYSELAFGKHSPRDSRLHVWLEFQSHDTIYVADPSLNYKIEYKSTGNIKGTLPTRYYELLNHKEDIDFLEELVRAYESRNNSHLIFKNHPENRSVNIFTVQETFNTAKKFRYVPDGIIVFNDTDYWKTPFETQSTLEGDCEDKSIYLQDRLRSKGIYADLVDGKYSDSSATFHVWVELKSRDTTYLLDPTGDKIFYKNSPEKGIIGNVPDGKYIEYPLRPYIEYKIIEYHMRNGVRLRFKNKR